MKEYTIYSKAYDSRTGSKAYGKLEAIIIASSFKTACIRLLDTPRGIFLVDRTLYTSELEAKNGTM